MNYQHGVSIHTLLAIGSRWGPWKTWLTELCAFTNQASQIQWPPMRSQDSSSCAIKRPQTCMNSLTNVKKCTGATGTTRSSIIGATLLGSDVLTLERKSPNSTDKNLSSFSSLSIKVNSLIETSITFSRSMFRCRHSWKDIISSHNL